MRAHALQWVCDDVLPITSPVSRGPGPLGELEISSDLRVWEIPGRLAPRIWNEPTAVTERPVSLLERNQPTPNDLKSIAVSRADGRPHLPPMSVRQSNARLLYFAATSAVSY